MKSLLYRMISVFSCTIFLAGCGRTAPKITTDVIAPVMLGGACGYVDGNGIPIIEPQFDNCGSFSTNGLAPACRNGKYGFIDTSGTFAINPQFDSASVFSEGCAVVCMDGAYGVIDEKGNWIAAPSWTGIQDFAGCGLAAVMQDTLYGYMDIWTGPVRSSLIFSLTMWTLLRMTDWLS